MKKYLFLLVLRDTGREDWCSMLIPADDEQEAHNIAESNLRDGDELDGQKYGYDVSILVGEYKGGDTLGIPQGTDWHQGETERATGEEIQRARDRYALDSSDDIRIDDDAQTSEADNGTWVQAWVFLKDEGSNLCNMHEWEHHEDIRRAYKGKRYEIVDNELVGNISYYLVYRASWPQGMQFHYMSANPDFSCAYDSLAEVGEPFRQWFIDAMNRYSEKTQS
jgi:hypothetical protein